MMNKPSVRGFGRIGAAVLVGLLGGSLLVQPAGAHLGGFKHLKKHFYTKTAADNRFLFAGEKAVDSDLLDGIDSSVLFTDANLGVKSTAAVQFGNTTGEQTLGALNLAGGEYLVLARVKLDNNDGGTITPVCRLRAGSTLIDEAAEKLDDNVFDDQDMLVLMGVTASSGPFALIVTCEDGGATSVLGLPRVSALKVSDVDTIAMP